MKLKIYHILSHTLEDFYPNELTEIGSYTKLQHTINKIIYGIKSTPGGEEYEHILCLPSKKYGNGTPSTMHIDGYEIRFFQSISLGFPFEFSSELIKFLRKTDNGIFHIYGTGSFLYDSIAPFLINKKSIAHYMGGHFTWKFFPFSFIKYFILQPITLRFPKLLFIQNNYRIEIYNRYLRIPKAKMKFIPVAINEDDFTKKPIKANKQNINITFISRVEKAKGIYELLEAFKRLSDEFDCIKLIIAGTGSELSRVKTQIEGENNIAYVGNLTYNQVRESLLDADIFVLPTYFDCFPAAVVEAGASGVPSISTTTEGPLSIIKDGITGYLIPPKDIQSLVEKLKLLIGDEKLRQKIGKQAKSHILENFTWKIVGKDYLDNYKNLL